MKIAIAKNKYTGLQPQKVRLIADMVRNLDPEIASAKLDFVVNSGAIGVKKTINSAIANAKVLGMEAPFIICELFVDEAPTRKGHRIVSRGRGRTILHRSSHITVKLKEKDGK